MWPVSVVLEEVASEARQLGEGAAERGRQQAPGADGQTVEAAEVYQPAT
jgi:hypothetical protein